MPGKLFLPWHVGGDKGHRSGVRHAQGGKGLHESVQNILQTYHKSLKTSASVHTERSRGYDVQLRAFAANEIKYGAIKRVMGLSLNNCRRRGSSVRKIVCLRTLYIDYINSRYGMDHWQYKHKRKGSQMNSLDLRVEPHSNASRHITNRTWTRRSWLP
jgi:hypothetical protein